MRPGPTITRLDGLSTRPAYAYADRVRLSLTTTTTARAISARATMNPITGGKNGRIQASTAPASTRMASVKPAFSQSHLFKIGGMRESPPQGCERHPFTNPLQLKAHRLREAA